MAWRGERPGVPLRLPLQPAIAPSGRDRERLDPPVSVRCRERGVSRVAHLPRSQDLESADLAKVVTCGAFALLPPSDFPRRRPRRNSEDVVVPFPLPCLQSIAPSLTKYASTALPPARFAIQLGDLSCPGAAWRTSSHAQ